MELYSDLELGDLQRWPLKRQFAATTHCTYTHSHKSVLLNGALFFFSNYSICRLLMYFILFSAHYIPCTLLCSDFVCISNGRISHFFKFFMLGKCTLISLFQAMKIQFFRLRDKIIFSLSVKVGLKNFFFSINYRIFSYSGQLRISHYARIKIKFTRSITVELTNTKSVNLFTVHSVNFVFFVLFFNFCLCMVSSILFQTLHTFKFTLGELQRKTA